MGGLYFGFRGVVFHRFVLFCPLKVPIYFTHVPILICRFFDILKGVVLLFFRGLKSGIVKDPFGIAVGRPSGVCRAYLSWVSFLLWFRPKYRHRFRL